MDLPKIAEKVFRTDCIPDFQNRILSQTSKKQFLSEVRAWLEEFSNNLKYLDDDNLNIGSDHDNQPGRIGSKTVCFTLDRSFGMVIMNQDGLKISSASRFSTIAASCAVFSGKWMYEVHLSSKGIMQIGWCSNLCQFTLDRGCGDTMHSYAYDGARVKSWNMLSKDYGEEWRLGDVIGICIDLDGGTMNFFRNGRSLGTAFNNITTGSNMVYIPCVSLIEAEGVFANFGGSPFRYPIDGYQPLQCQPTHHIKQAEHVLKWLKNLTNLVVPTEPKILNCTAEDDITDRKFWNRLFSSICYFMSSVLTNRYCLLGNFIPFIEDIVQVNQQKEKKLDLVRYLKVMDQLWMNVRERIMDKALHIIFSDLLHSLEQVSDSLDCSQQQNIIELCSVFLSHEATRKYFINNFLFNRISVFDFLQHKPLDDRYLELNIPNAWWDTKGCLPDIEKNKKNFKKIFAKIEKSYAELDKKQSEFLKLLLNNTDGTDTEPSSRMLFLQKLRKFCCREIQNELFSKFLPSMAYSAFFRFVRVLDELWKLEIGEESIIVPCRYFFDRTINYSDSDRVGGLEHYLIHLYRDALARELGEDHRVFRSSIERHTASLPIVELRAVGGITEVVSLLNNSEENFAQHLLLPDTPNGLILRAVFSSILKDNEADILNGNMDCRISLIELFEDLLMIFITTVYKRCQKLSELYQHFKLSAMNFNNIYISYKKIQKTKSDTGPLVMCLKTTMDLQKPELNKIAKNFAWFESVILNDETITNFLKIFDYLISTVIQAETMGELFAFLPNFYFEACDIFTDSLVKDFMNVHTIQKTDVIDSILIKEADLMIRLLRDKRLTHIDTKKIPINVLATLAGNSATMKILESVGEERSKELIGKLMEPYGDRHWLGSNWILIRFWHGSGFGFRYSVFPHYTVIEEKLKSAQNFVMHNIASCPSAYYQNLVRQHLLDTMASIPSLLDSIISELHWIFGEFLAPMQELQRVIERNTEQILLMKLYKACAKYFDKTIGLLRTLDMFISLAPEVFLESYFSESTSLTKRIIEVVLLIIHRISSKQGCFRTVMNSRLVTLENVDYLPIESACIAVLLGILKPELINFKKDELLIPVFTRMVLRDSSYDIENLKVLVGSPETKNSAVISLHDYGNDMLDSELVQARNMINMLAYYFPALSSLDIIPDDILCTICYSAPFDVKFSPCGHHSCLSCITYYLKKSRLCFFCKRSVLKVIKLETDEVIDSLTDTTTLSALDS